MSDEERDDEQTAQDYDVPASSDPALIDAFNQLRMLRASGGAIGDVTVIERALLGESGE